MVPASVARILEQSWIGRGMAFLLLAGALLATTAASAQRPLQQVLDLNRQAMDHYMNLEIPEAEQKLRRATQLAERSGVTGAALARTYMNLAVVSVGGMQDNAAGLEHFVAALRADAGVQLDPLTSTPEIQTVFNLARQRVRSSGGGLPEPAAVGTGTIPHNPVPEQLAQTAVPVYVELPDVSAVAHVYLYYKGLGMRDYRRVEMRSVAGGYGFEVPCADVFEPTMEYYIVAFGDDGGPLGFAGTAQEPITVPIVSMRTHPPPALPGSAPPEQCADSECPPGMPGCDDSGGGGLGDTCVTSNDCREGLLCDDNFCVSDEDDDEDDDDEEEDEEAGDAPRTFLHLGGTVGFAYTAGGLPADGAPQPGDTSGVYIPEGTGECTDNMDAIQDYCVRIETPGFVPTIALSFTGGYYITERFAAAVSVRFQPSSGQGAMANMLIGVRGQYLFTTPRAEGLGVAASLGSSYGQIQPQPPQNGAAEPFIRSGLNSIDAGGVITYRMARMFGIHITPQVHVMLPLFLLDIDLTAGLEIAF